MGIVSSEQEEAAGAAGASGAAAAADWETQQQQQQQRLEKHISIKMWASAAVAFHVHTSGRAMIPEELHEANQATSRYWDARMSQAQAQPQLLRDMQRIRAALLGVTCEDVTRVLEVIRDPSLDTSAARDVGLLAHSCV